MVRIDTVYQKVLALANKEQRGYITPQEFNLMANKAQMDIFESYFHDMKTAYHKPKNNINFADEMEIIEEKLQPFYTFSPVLVEGPSLSIELPGGIYRLKSVLGPGSVPVTQVTEKEYFYIINNPLTKPTADRPIYWRWKLGGINSLYINPGVDDGEVAGYSLGYWRKPIDPKWAYVVVQEKALYNANLTTNFELHPSEEEALVTRILQLSGITIKKPELVEIAMTDNAQTKQQQND